MREKGREKNEIEEKGEEGAAVVKHGRGEMSVRWRRGKKEKEKKRKKGERCVRVREREREKKRKREEKGEGHMVVFV